MIKEADLQYLIHNGKVCSIEEMNIENKAEEISIYEVIRIIDGIPLYLEEHLERLKKSSELLGIQLNKTDEDLVNEIVKLIEINEGYNCNIKILCSGMEAQIDNIYLYFIKSYYPPRSMYEEGINTILFRSERENPNAKTYNRELRERINEELKERKAFEALLVNNDGGITEGSRSNVFFVKDNILFTSPPSEVLLGVTRTKIIELCRLNEVKVVEKEASSEALQEYDGAFITGTSTNVLPIKTIDDIRIASCENGLIIKVMKIYEEDKNNYIKQKS
ncbi:aminotransferase class IV [Wukongibacter baidiensis]|uniref:aminotransferase class IV n=1 Tax=Wukongibacter baidiensis TaxID=1723361 RepID=UPI003D7FBFA0